MVPDSESQEHSYWRAAKFEGQMCIHTLAKVTRVVYNDVPLIHTRTE